MSGEFEAGGALVTAGLVAKELQPGEAHHEGDGSACINCGAPLNGKFCAACGQPAHIHRTLGHMFEEALHGVLHFDGRFWRTLPKLVLRPGTLTHDHIIGRRARYVSPLAAFLFTVFLMFFVFAMVGERAPPTRPPSLAALEESQSQQSAVLADANANLAAASAAWSAAPETIGPDEKERLREAVADQNERVRETQADLAETEALLTAERQRITGLKAALAQLEKSEAETPADANEDAAVQLDVAKTIIEHALADPEGVTPAVEATIGPDGGVTVNNTQFASGMESIFKQIREANAAGELKVNTGNKTFDKKLKAKLENPELAWYKIENSAYKFSFLLVPLSLPFVWLVFFWKRELTLFDHSVFILYSLTFMSLLFIVLAIASRGPDWLKYILPWLVLVPPVHMFFHLKGTYSLSWFSALWRSVFLMFSAMSCLLMFMGIIVFAGLVG